MTVLLFLETQPIFVRLGCEWIFFEFVLHAKQMFMHVFNSRTMRVFRQSVVVTTRVEGGALGDDPWSSVVMHCMFGLDILQCGKTIKPTW